MTGYNYALGMSNRAVQAYENGKMPLSKVTKTALIRNGIRQNITVGFAKWLLTTYIKRCEYHHTGGTWYNTTDFYCLDSLADFIKSTNANDLAEMERAFKKSKQTTQTEQEQKAIATYHVWGGSRKHPKIIDTITQEGVIRGNWIHFKNGTKKNINGNHITVKYI